MRDRHGGVAASAALLGMAAAWLVLGGTLDTGPGIPDAPGPRNVLALERSLNAPAPARDALVLAQPRTTATTELEVLPLPDDAFLCEISVDGGAPRDGLPVSVEPMGLDESVWVEAQVAHGGVWIDPSTPRGTARVRIPGFLPATLDWWDDRCLGLRLEHMAGEVAGEVLDTEGWPVPGAWVRCPSGETAADADGRFRCELPPHRVALTARRVDGLLTVLSEPVSVTVGSAERGEVVLTLPSGPHGGIGATLRPSVDGVELGWIVPGAAAHHVGLEAGDTLLELDGQLLVGLGPEAVMRQIVGAVGTELELLVRDGLGDERRVVVKRRRVESPHAVAALD